MQTILVSKTHRSEVVHSVHTKAQRETVQKITESPEFDFACGNPFKKEVGVHCHCTFSFLYFTKDKNLHLANISPTGRITKRVTAD